MKIKRKLTNKNYYLVNMIIFIGFSFEFFIRSDDFLGVLIFFTGLINLLAFQQAPRKVASITVILNLFNALISTTIAYNYANINYEILLYVWTGIAVLYYISTISQITNLSQYRISKQKRRKKYH